MKSTQKAKSSEIPKGCVNILSFFKSQTDKKIPKPITNNEIIVLNSDDDTDVDTKDTTKKRKLSGSNNLQPPAKKKEITVKNNSPASTSNNRRNSPGTPPQYISVKSPEKLYSPVALKELNTPEKKCQSTTKSKKSPGRRKVLHEDTKADTENGDQTPDVKSSKKLQNSASKFSPGISPSPSKRRTPKKLFEKSPSNLGTFNVEVVENFFKMTPSKSNKADSDEDDNKSSSKKQSSIKKYLCSQHPSNGSLEAQIHNEQTPTKQKQNDVTSIVSPVARAKTKLDFSSCTINRTTRQSPKKQNGNVIDSPSSLSVKANQENDANFSNVDFNFDDSWDGQDQIQTPISYNLDLTESHHCKITNITEDTFKTVLTVKSTKTSDQALCNVEGFWVHIKLCVGDIVHISAKKTESGWIVDNENGLLVYEPDLLISTTTIVGTVFCKRRSVFQEKFRGFETTNKYMVVGTLVHTLIERVLKWQRYKKQEIEELVKEMIADKDMVRRIYECGEKLEYISNEILQYVPKIEDFINTYVNSTSKKINLKPKKDNWQGRISSIDDVEENIWCPELGVKGKVDVSIRTDNLTLPLEVKTGRASVSLEHRGQVMLYIMMMNKLGYIVPSGLLLYLKEGVLKEIPMTIHEKRDIVILRNELAYYLLRQPTLNINNNEKQIMPAEVPEIISHPSCTKCPYNIICSSYARFTNENISKNKGLSEIKEETLKYLSNDHLQFFMKWVSLIALESNVKLGSKDLREIYTLPPQQRELNGKCIINLKVSNIDAECNGTFLHTFEKFETSNNINFYASGFNENSYVIVSTDFRPAVATGFVSSITSSSLSIALDRNLHKKYSSNTFHIDSYDSNVVQSYNMAGLSLLLEATPRAADLRRMIIDKEPPSFLDKLPKIVAKKGLPILKRLNKVQQRAVLKGLAAKDYLLIKGMPGTGKTATIVALVQLLVELNKSVIITSHTHSAVDNVCSRLIKFGVKLMRLGNERKMQDSLKEYSEYNLTKHCTTPEELEKVYNSAQILAVTCLGSGHPVLSKRMMDICIVDESTQVLQSSVIRPLYAARTFILIGDPEQLPAVVKNPDAVEMGMNESLFERLLAPESVLALNINYRMNTPITALANHLTYNQELGIGSNLVANATLQLPLREKMEEEYNSFDWLIKTLDDKLEKSVYVVDTGPVWQLKHEVSWQSHKSEDQNEFKNCVNVYEAAVATHLVRALLKGGLNKDNIGVIATYRAQVAQISSLLASDKVDVSTVDQFQGKDKSVIIYSCTKSKDVSTHSSTNKFDLLDDKRRLTVAITRAKHKLIILGDVQTLQCYSTYRKLLSFVENIVTLRENENEFTWRSILDIM